MADWHGGRWTLDTAHRNAAGFAEASRTDRVHDMERLGMRHDRDIIWHGDPFVLYTLGRRA